MTNKWDEFSKSLAQPVPRRESMRRLAIALAGAVLSPLESGFAGHQDPCKAFCRCRNKKQQNQCLTACKACNKDVSRLAGSCGNYFCCGAGQSSCGSYCADFGNDPYNCGACGYACDQPGRYEYGACIDGECRYTCAEGAVYCNGFCTFLGWDPNNCGACGNVCDASTVCSQGVCNPCLFPFILCGGVCVDPTSDPYNCGACFQQCAPSEVCVSGFCESGGGGGEWW
jgi:hypothetical protein